MSSRNISYLICGFNIPYISTVSSERLPILLFNLVSFKISETVGGPVSVHYFITFVITKVGRTGFNNERFPNHPCTSLRLVLMEWCLIKNPSLSSLLV